MNVNDIDIARFDERKIKVSVQSQDTEWKAILDYVTVRNEIKSIELETENISNKAHTLAFIIRYMRHCSQKVSYKPKKNRLKFNY
jgi:hypothetical protein